MRTLYITAAILLAAALPAVALASRAPSRSERVELRKAVTSSKLGSKAVRKGKFKLVKPKISTDGPWAKAGVVPTGTYSDPFNPTRGIFKKSNGAWHLVKLGGSKAGCKHPRLPRSVRKDLKIKC
jgi:hypothetical protein